MGHHPAGGKISGYELRGRGKGLDAWIKAKSGDLRTEPSSEEMQALLEMVLDTRSLFFPD